MQQPLAKLEAEREKTVNPEPSKFNQNYMVDEPYKFIDKNGKIYYVIVKSKSDDGNEMTGLVKIKKEIPKRTTKVEFKKCTDFPFEVGCQNDKIKDIQKWLGLSSDGSYGNDTYNKLIDLKYPVVITKEIYSQIKAEYESSQKKVEPDKPIVKEETIQKTETPVVTEKSTETKKEQNAENVKTGNNGELILIIGDSQSAVYLNGNTDGALKIDSNGELKYTFGPAKSSWPNYFSHNGAKLHAGVDVLALGAQTTGWMLNGSDKGPGLKTYLSKTKKKYTKIIIWGGGNDCTNGWDIDKVTVNNIQTMVDLGIKHGAKVYVCSGYKVEGVDGKGGLDAKGSGKIEYYSDDKKNDKGRIVGYEKYTQTNGSPVVWPAFGNWTKLTKMGTLKGPEDWKKRIALRKRLFDEVILNNIKRAYLIPTMDLQKNSSDGLHATAAGYKIAARKIMDALEGKNVINPK
jgi:lysophospholipase L1-like esterase